MPPVGVRRHKRKNGFFVYEEEEENVVSSDDFDPDDSKKKKKKKVVFSGNILQVLGVSLYVFKIFGFYAVLVPSMILTDETKKLERIALCAAYVVTSSPGLTARLRQRTPSSWPSCSCSCRRACSMRW